VAELRRTEQQSDVGFKAAQELEWQKRQAEISRQAEEARRLKRQRRAANEKAAKQQVA
jgi:transcription elongation GreA/GreB family factor